MTPFEERLLDKQDDVLREIAALRVDCEKRFAELEQHDHDCYGNGQQGWKKDHEAEQAATRKDIEEIKAALAEKKGANGVWGWVFAAAVSVANIVVDFHRR